MWGRPRPATLWKMQSTSRADGGPSPGKPSVESNAKPSLPQATCRAADSRRRNDRPQRTALGAPSLRACMQHCDAVTRARSHPVILTDCRGRAGRTDTWTQPIPRTNMCDQSGAPLYLCHHHNPVPSATGRGGSPPGMPASLPLPTVDWPPVGTM